LNSHGKNRHSRAIIDLQALRENYRLLKKIAGGNRLIAVVKADAYGHGAVEVASALNEADAFAVASVGEAVALRKAGIAQKIVVLGGFISAEELQICIDHALDPVLHQQFHLDCLTAVADLVELEVWLKFDTGMGRLGFPLFDIVGIVDFLHNLNGLGSVRMMTHLANADALDDSFTDFQLQQVKSLGLDAYEWGIANSAGILGWPTAHNAWARAGIALYGADPMSDRKLNQRGLRAAMTMKSRVLAVNQHSKGDMIGYGHTYTCPADMTIAVVAAGYADGYPRHKNATAQVAIGGSLCGLVGRVSMDMITVDVSHLAGVQVNDEVTLFGASPDVNDIAEASQTIAYEILCNVGAHVQREYINLD
jgi:alanine racemase